MDTATFLLNRESLQARLEALRGASTAARQKGRWWLGLPLFPVAGWLAAKAINSRQHPLVTGLLFGAARRLFSSAAKRWSLNGFFHPPLLKRVLSFL